MASILEHCHDMVGVHETATLLASKKIQCVPLEFMRGSNFDRCVIIADEMQNASLHQTRTLLTRLKEDTQLVLTGDLAQCDLPNPKDSGLPMTIKVLGDVKGCAFVEFGPDDIVRSGIVKEITLAFKKYGL